MREQSRKGLRITAGTSIKVALFRAGTLKLRKQEAQAGLRS